MMEREKRVLTFVFSTVHIPCSFNEDTHLRGNKGIPCELLSNEEIRGIIPRRKTPPVGKACD